MIEYRSSGGDYRRCDAKCYNANNSTCTCVCGGGNHGGGKEAALENTSQVAEALLTKAGREDVVEQIERWREDQRKIQLGDPTRDPKPRRRRPKQARFEDLMTGETMTVPKWAGELKAAGVGEMIRRDQESQG